MLSNQLMGVASAVVPALVAYAVAAGWNAETQPHFIGRFTPTKLFALPSLRQHADFEPPVQETNTHTIGRFTPARLTVPFNLYQNYPGDLSSVVVVQAETNTHFIGRYRIQSPGQRVRGD
jgi:hypothetical protein